MTNPTPTPTEIITDDEVVMLNMARTILARIGKRAERTFSGGRVIEQCEGAEYEVFQTLNCVSVYGGANLTDEQLHNDPKWTEKYATETP